MSAQTAARKVFLQDCRTKLYLDYRNGWTSDSDTAQDFKTTLNAVAHALHHKISNAQMLVRYSDSNLKDIVVPLSDDASAHS